MEGVDGRGRRGTGTGKARVLDSMCWCSPNNGYFRFIHRFSGWCVICVRMCVCVGRIEKKCEGKEEVWCGGR